jgi:hypothetical protein
MSFRTAKYGALDSIFIVVGSAGALLAACSSSNSPNTPNAPAGLTCVSPGAATAGPQDMHCVGVTPQVVNPASCAGPEAGASSDDGGSTDDASAASSGDDAGTASSDDDCDYGATMFAGNATAGQPVEGDDDDCKYHVSWASTPICESSTLGVTFTVTVTNLTTGAPVTDIPAAEGILPEAFIPETLDASCDTMTEHESPTGFGSAHLFETTPTSGVYVGNVIFDQSGQWTVRFHIHEECSDALDDSPHGHAAFRITVP